MKKAMVIMNGETFNEHIITSACNVAKASSSTLHAFFLTHDSASPQFDYLFPNDLTLTQENISGKSVAEENAALVNDSIKVFIDVCDEKGVEYIIERDTHFTLKQLINYTAFCDFVMADARANLDQYRLSDLLTDAHCPVLLTSTNDGPVQRVIFAYDGSYSSMHAIKMYAYIFPEWNNIDTHLIYLASNKDDKLPFEERIKGWLSQHYHNIKIEVLKGNVQENLTGFINSGPDGTVVVMGAYGRSNLSRIMHKSLADVVAEKTKASLFIIHL